MKPENLEILDANEATANVAYKLSEVIAIYPITPSSAMAEHCDEWRSKGQKNLFNTIPSIEEMQSEGGAAGAIHGALLSGMLATTFTASQGLLLMIPNMYKIAGELLPFVMHVTARSLATHALSIFGDHSDVMACRQTGFAMLASDSVQGAHDMAAVAHAATLKSRVPFMHFFDGFRTSHEVNCFEKLSDDQLNSMIDENLINENRMRGLSPDNPFIKGTAQNPDVFFQARERANNFYENTPAIVEDTMKKFEDLTGRKYKLFEYIGAADAERVIISIGSSCSTIAQTVEHLNKSGEKVGLLKVRLFRPFSVKHFINELPKTVKSIAVLDRTKESGSVAEPLCLDIVSAIDTAFTENLVSANFRPKIIGGRYGLGSKEFTPSMAKDVFDELKKSTPKKHFTVGINDDITHLSLSYDSTWQIGNNDVFESVFFGLGADGTVGANKNTIKIIGHDTDNYAQAYFVYDSKKSGAITVSHLRFGKNKIEAPYLINKAQFVACHQFSFLEKYDILKYSRPGSILLINSPFKRETVWQHLPKMVQQQIIDLKLKVYVIDAYDVARAAGMGGRTNTIMQTCFFAISGILPKAEAIEKIKNSIGKSYASKGEQVVQKNFAAVDATLDNLFELEIGKEINGKEMFCGNFNEAPDFVKNITSVMLRNEGDTLPVSAIPIDGTWPSATSQYEKRNIAQEIPVWDPSICIQCNKCVSICPHAAIRAKFYNEDGLAKAPEGFKSVDFKSKDAPNCKYTIQCTPADCTGCGLCVANCPAKNKTNPELKAINLKSNAKIGAQEQEFYDFFIKLPNPDPTKLGNDLKSIQFKQPLFEYSGACSGCGETPYLKLLTQMFGDRMIIANATGCSSIYGGNLPTTPYCKNSEGRGPAWANSLFEDNAEFGFGMRVATDKKREIARELLVELSSEVGSELANEILSENKSDETSIAAQRERVAQLKSKLQSSKKQKSKTLLTIADFLVEKSMWIIGGDGWAYDIGYGGLDHVLASGKNVNVLVLDTEVYSNTGGQQSKSTPTGAVAKFAASGKANQKKDLGLLAMSYGNVYVAKVALGAKDSQTIQAFREAESYNGPSLIIAYSPCIAHGYDLSNALDQQKKAVDSGYWPLFRFDPRKSENAFSLDSSTPKLPLIEYMQNENRFKSLMVSNPEHAEELMHKQEHFISDKLAFYQKLADKK